MFYTCFPGGILKDLRVDILHTLHGWDLFKMAFSHKSTGIYATRMIYQ